MSNEQEIIDELQEYLDIGDNDRIALYPEEVRMCIEALEKQIAKKPKKIEVEGYRYTDTYRCPTCEGNFSGTGIAYYCYRCGQKLDWSVEDEQKAT